MFQRPFFGILRKPSLSFRSPSLRRYANEAPIQPTSQSRIERFNRRLPRFLHKYTSALATAPLTHMTAFLLLHEITAIIPLFGLAATFHYTHWLPRWFSEGTWVLSGVEKFGRYFKRKGWIRGEEAAEAEEEAKMDMRRRDKAWNVSEGGVRVVVEFATAYAITKALLPLRIMLSVWGTPWFATRTVVPVRNWVKGVLARRKAAKVVDPAKTGAVGGGAVPKAKE
jgi:hypothetical protein